MAKIETLIDNFNDNSFNTDLWVNIDDDGGEFFKTEEKNQQIEFTLPANSEGAAGMRSKIGYDFADSYATIEIVQVATDHVLDFQILDATSSYYATWRILANGNLVAQGWEIEETTTFNATTHKYLRIRESDGTVYWDYSANYTDWTNFASEENSETITACKIYVMASTNGTDKGAAVLKIDNITTNGAGSTSESTSTSSSPSTSESASPSVSPSTSESSSPSVSESTSESASPSPSTSESTSESMSPSVSESVSPSTSESASESVSESISPSISPSVSPSISPSVSPSTSSSVSPSISPSISPSASPSE